MTLELNGKVYGGRWHNAGTIELTLMSEEEWEFFMEWMEQATKSTYKRDYAKDIKYAWWKKKGTLVGCFPIKLPCEWTGSGEVEIHYDANYMDSMPS